MRNIENLSLEDLLKEIEKDKMIRCTKNQKENFAQWVKGSFPNANIEKGKHQNIIIGDIKKAKYIFTAHYDTVNIFSFTKTFYFNGYGKILKTIYDLWYPALMLFLFILTFKFVQEELLQIAIILLIIIMFFGFIWISPKIPIPNKYNYNDNTSGVLTVLKLAANNTNNSNLAFILFDNEEKGCKGSKSFVKEYKKNNKTSKCFLKFFSRRLHDKNNKDKILINFDCVGDGNKFIVVSTKKDDNFSEQIKHYEKNSSKSFKFVEKKKLKSDHASFKKIDIKSYGFMSFQEYSNGNLFTDKLHSSKDSCIDLSNIQDLINGTKTLLTDL